MCTKGVEWPCFEVRVKEELDERETAAEQLACATLRAAGVVPLVTLYHARARTCADADANAAGLRGAFTKTLFLRDCSEPPTRWLVLTVGSARPDLTALKKALGARGKLRMGDEAELLAVLGVTPGAVTPLALVNDRPDGTAGWKPVRLVVDRALWKTAAFEGLLNVHPMHNAASTTLSADGLLAYCKHTGHNVHAFIDTTTTPMGIEVVEQDVLAQQLQQQRQPKAPPPQAAAHNKKTPKPHTKGADLSPEAAEIKKRWAAALVLSAAGAVLGSADGTLASTSGAAEAAAAIRSHAAAAAEAPLSSLDISCGSAWKLPAHAVRHITTAEALLSGKRGTDFAKVREARLRSADASARWADARPDSADDACALLSVGLALQSLGPLDVAQTVLACTEGATGAARAAACMAALLVRLAALHRRPQLAWCAELAAQLRATADEAGAAELLAKYQAARAGSGGGEQPVYAADWTSPEARDAWHKDVLGEEAPLGVRTVLVAVDALVFAETTATSDSDRWERLLCACACGPETTHAMAIAALCYGLAHEFAGVPDKQHKKVEQASNLARIAAKLSEQQCRQAQQGGENPKQAPK